MIYKFIRSKNTLTLQFDRAKLSLEMIKELIDFHLNDKKIKKIKIYIKDK